MNSTNPPSWGQLLYGRNGLLSIALAGGVALHAINIYVTTTILPSVVRDIGGLEYYAWNTTLFMVASIIGAPLSKSVLSRFGPRAAYVIALIIFCIGTFICSSAKDMLWMLTGRFIQGFGGGILFALSYALIRIVFNERLWSRAMAMVSGMWGIATLCGPAIGGIFAHSDSWRFAFIALLPVAALLAIIVLTQLPSHEKSNIQSGQVALGKILLLGVSVLTISVASLSKEISVNIVGVAAGLTIAALIARFDHQAKIKLMPTGAYNIHMPLGAIYACMSLLVIGITTEIFVPYFLQTIHGYSPLIAGYATALMAAGWTVGSLFSSGRSPHTAQKFVRLGPVLVVLALLVLAIIIPAQHLFGSATSFILICIVLTAVGIGIGATWPHLLTQVLKNAPAGQEDLASTSITTVQLYATAIGSALAGIVANLAGFSDPGGLAGAQNAAMWLFAIFAIAPVLATFVARRAAIQKSGSASQ
ncbi:MFS family major facilitator transporter [Xenorhabdus mauleonii]|uniref:MFS family major facilitator transporter n=1 Tax=Xenorhabdus mauleonii TaxID=351675 RepID=A0A1I3RB94_9GAMM|nr:MFS transporter [Xenorhabdus mauleonii]PHM39815.1 MFS family major facilitator transporter [Xenorhabdus mauleonii]SFJ43320.1 Predicted arabinose efflux permease, MFS family [Xenorhabdus mauleonii]